MANLAIDIQASLFFFRRFVREESSHGPSSTGRGTTTEEDDTKLEEDFIEAVRKNIFESFIKLIDCYIFAAKEHQIESGYCIVGHVGCYQAASNTKCLFIMNGTGMLDAPTSRRSSAWPLTR